MSEWGQLTDFAAEYSPIPYTGTAINIASSLTGSAGNLLGFTSGTCGKIPSDAQLASILRSAPADQPEMKRTRERFGRSETESRLYSLGGPADRAIYNAPISAVGAWARFDCKSAGPIRQSLAADLAVLNQQYGAAPAALTYGTLETPAPVPVLAPAPGWTGSVGVTGAGVSGGVTFGDPGTSVAPWLLLAVGAVAIILVVWGVLRGGR